VGVIGAGTMGSGIAQVAATAGHSVVVFDADASAAARARESLGILFDRLVDKGRVDRSTADEILGRIDFADDIAALEPCGLVIEAIIEDLAVKQSVFKALDGLVVADAVLATNTSSLSVAAISSACREPSRVIGVHFFNPAPLMPLVEIVPGIMTSPDVAEATRALVDSWGKTTVTAKDTPGFIVNRVARPFYGEAIRIMEEGIADVATIDWAMKDLGGFRMGPFELMDLIGNDVNFTVTETVYEAFFHDPRYKPSFTQKRLVEAGLLGRKSGRGWYWHADAARNADAVTDKTLGSAIVDRIVAMLINEAIDALFWAVASRDDIDLAMTKGVNYPKGLLAWADDIGPGEILERLQFLQDEYGEDRYRPSPLLRRAARDGASFY
jgi:3-hydroxybutyryl-CoA dehydrogenase